jgi:amino acid transporter
VVYLAGTWAVLVVLPASKVDVVTGTLQTIDAVARRAGFGSVAQLMGLLLPLSTLGGTGAWLAGSARIPFVAGIDRFLPPAFARVHPRWHTPYVAILTQGVLASLFLVLGFPGSTVAETYLLLCELSVIVYFIPYLYLFLCAMQANRTVAEAVALPGGRLSIWLGSITGFAVALLAIVVSLIPSSAVTNFWLYEAKLVGGSVLFLAVGLILYTRRRA